VTEGDATEREQFYRFSDNKDDGLLLLHAKIFCSLMKNVNVVKWVARNLLVDLRFAFICFSAASKEGSRPR
jgi:hypothetical protein